MDQPRASSPLLPENRVAMTLVLIGLGGLCYHFAINPDSAISATAPGPAPGPYIAPVPPLARGDRGTSPATNDVKEMRRQLREFIIPLPDIKALPVTDALALLENHWLSLPHETDQIPPASFTLNNAASKQVAAANPPQLICLEIPGVSLLTNLNLLAAQAGLQVTVTKTGAMLEAVARSNGDLHQTATTILSNETVNQYRFRAKQGVEGGWTVESEIPGSLRMFASALEALDSRQQDLEKIFRPMGLSQLGDLPSYSWSPSDGILTANGSSRHLRIAAAVAAALEEAAHSGVEVEFLAADWKDKKPPALPQTEDPKKPGSARASFQSNDRKPLRSKMTSLRARFDRNTASMVLPPPTRPYLVFPEPGNRVNISTRPTGSRFSLELAVIIKPPTNMLLPPGANKDPDFSKPFFGTVCRNGEWTRLDFPLRQADPDGPQQSLFLRVTRRTLGPEE